MIVLDTDHMSLLEWETGEATLRLQLRLLTLPEAERATTIVSYEEQTRGWLAVVGASRTVSQMLAAYRRLHLNLMVYRRIHVLPFDDRAAVEFQRFRGLKIRIGTMDLKIAAIALSMNATLLTRNRSDFEKVPKLKVEDWTA